MDDVGTIAPGDRQRTGSGPAADAAAGDRARRRAGQTERVPRDGHRSKVYTVERHVMAMLDRAERSGVPTVEFFGSTLTLPGERRFADLAAVRDHVSEVLGMQEVVDTWGRVPAVTVRMRRGPRAAHYESSGVIAVPAGERWAMRELVLCHELAHHLATHSRRGRRRPSSPAPGHGPAFTASYVRLAGLTVGREVELLLRAGFDAAGIPVGRLGVDGGEGA